MQSTSCSERGHCPYLPSSRSQTTVSPRIGGDSTRAPQVEAEREAVSLGLGGNFRRARSTLGAARDLFLDVLATSVSVLQGEGSCLLIRLAEDVT